MFVKENPDRKKKDRFKDWDYKIKRTFTLQLKLDC